MNEKDIVESPQGDSFSLEEIEEGIRRIERLGESGYMRETAELFAQNMRKRFKLKESHEK